MAAYEKRTGWDFKWVSFYDTDFNFDYNVSFTPEEVAKKAINGSSNEDRLFYRWVIFVGYLIMKLKKISPDNLIVRRNG